MKPEDRRRLKQHIEMIVEHKMPAHHMEGDKRMTFGGNGSHWDGCAETHWDCKIAQLEAELKITDELLKEATETIGAVIACCTYNSNDDAKIGIYGIDQKAFTRIDQFITHYNDAVSAGKVSVDVKVERKEFCPNCEAEVPCTHEAELYVCDICGEDFAKYIVSRNCTLPDVSMTQDVSIDIKTPSSIENTNPSILRKTDGLGNCILQETK